MGTEQMPMTMIRRIPKNNIELPGAGRAVVRQIVAPALKGFLST